MNKSIWLAIVFALLLIILAYWVSERLLTRLNEELNPTSDDVTQTLQSNSGSNKI